METIRETRIAVTLAKFIDDDTVKVEGNNGLNGVVELWEQDATNYLAVESITESPNFTVFFNSVDDEKCYYVVAKEATPSPNFDVAEVMDINGDPCADELEIPSFMPLTTASPRVTIQVTLGDERGSLPVDFAVFGRGDREKFNSDRFRTYQFTTEANGSLTEEVFLDLGHTHCAVFMTYRVDDENHKNMACQ